MDSMELRSRIRQLKIQIIDLQVTLETLEVECPHNIVKARIAGAECDICGRNFGWYCAESPDHACHYYTYDRKGTQVQLYDRTLHSLKEPSDPEYESDDCCLFCNQPDERK
jgi:hypothetical protein